MYRGADFSNSDHRMVVSKMRIRLPVAKKPKRNLIDLEGFKSLERRLDFELKIANRFGSLEDEARDIEEEWTELKEALVQSATEVCGTKKSRRPIWLTDELINLTEKKALLFAEWQSSQDQARETKYAEYRAVNRACIKATKEAKRTV